VKGRSVRIRPRHAAGPPPCLVAQARPGPTNSGIRLPVRVLDPRGVIRYKWVVGPGEKAINAALGELMKEIEATR
jgi:hypothetical protein